MWKYTVRVTGMMCGMCESHVNDAVRRAFPVKKVTSSRSKKETTVIAETELDEAPCGKPSGPPAMTQGDSERALGEEGAVRPVSGRDTDQQREEADGCWQRFWRTVETGRR